MQKIKLTESQILMLQKLGDKQPNKVIKINENQYNRLFKSNFKKSINEGVKKDVDLKKFAEELIVFIKDMVSSPDTAKTSKFWTKLGFTKESLISMLQDEGLLDMSLDETEGVKYVSEKQGFRKKVKGCYKKINELEVFDNEPNAPWNQTEPENETEPEVELGLKAKSKPLKLVYYSEEMDGLTIFKRGNDLFSITIHDLATAKADKFEQYLDSNQNLDTANGENVDEYVNDRLNKKEIKIFSKNAPEGEVSLITPNLKRKLLGWYGEDKTLVSILNNVTETSLSGGAGGDSGQVGGVGAMSSNVVKRDAKNSPQNNMSELISDDTEIEETTTTISAGGDSGTFAYDTPGFKKGVDMFAGNKENKKMPLVKRKVSEGKIKKGQVYKNGSARRKVLDIKVSNNPMIPNKIISVRQWGDKEARTLEISPKEWGTWELIHENKKVLKITESQFNKIKESEGEIKQTVDSGSTYAIELVKRGNKIMLSQDNGQTIVTHIDSIPDLIKVLKKLY